MPRLKRKSQTNGYEDGDEVIDVREASSSLQRSTGSRKKMRVSIDQTKSTNGRSAHRSSRAASISADESEDDMDDEDDNVSEPPASPPQTQYELMRDQGFVHLQQPERDDERATQKLQQRSLLRLGDNAAAESGIIESITCYNFMCHTRLHVELGPLINFIVGENGSGKSAVLTALTLCLGGKASDTNRGGSLRSFVKEGQDQASLVVKIKNAGTDAYQPDIYGASIIVERHFSKTGSSGFKIKSAQGRIISTKKQEVEEISEWYAMQISNPLTVLSQDNARQFLNAATPAQKYKYLVSGVQLEQLDNDYRMSQDTLQKTVLVREDLDSKIELVRKQMEQAQRLAETAQKNKSLREKARLWRNQMIWSQVVEQEEKLEAREAEIKERDEQIAEAERLCQERSEVLVSLQEKIAQAKEAFEQIRGSEGTVTEKVSEAETVYQSAKRELQNLQHEERDAAQGLKIMKSEMRDLERKIGEEESKLSEESGAQRSQKDAELQASLKREDDIKRQIEEAKTLGPQLRSAKDETVSSLRTKQKNNESKKQDLLAAEAHVQQLQKGSRSKYDAYEPEMAQLVRAVAGNNSFSHPPVGPLGAHIRLLKPEWSGILEKTFGEALNAFVVRNKRDQNQLSQLIRTFKFQRQPPVYIAYGSSIDTREQEPSPDFLTILRVLEFDDDIIRSQLVINNSIEKVILVQQRREAESLMLDGSRPPHNVVACLCFHDGQSKVGQGLRITRKADSVSSAPVTVARNQRARMQTDSARQLEHAKAQATQMGLQVQESMREERQARQACTAIDEKLSSHKRGMVQLENSLRKVQAEIEQAQMELDSFEGVDDRLNALREALKTKQDEETQLGTQYGNMRLAKKELNQKSEAAAAQLSEVKNERKDYEAQVNKALKKVETNENRRKLTVVEKNNAYEKLDIAKNERLRAEERHQEQTATTKEFREHALELAPERVHVPEGETYDSIEKKYEGVREQLKLRAKRLGATDEEIYDRATAAKEEYEDVQRQTEDVDITIQALKNAISSRLDMWRQFQRQISARIRIQFNYLLSERGFRGRIDIAHEPRTVNLQIEPDETRKSSSGRNTKTLSGGEKSFSSICMLLAVWEAMGSPIRCLDEFDVFMDNVNRAISTNLLVDAARRSVTRQYLLITPNAIEGRAKLQKDVKIIRLTDPRQRTLI